MDQRSFNTLGLNSDFQIDVSNDKLNFVASALQQIATFESCLHDPLICPSEYSSCHKNP